MTSGLNKSRPGYVPLKADLDGTRHPLVTSDLAPLEVWTELPEIERSYLQRYTRFVSTCHPDGAGYPQRGSPLWQIARRS